jgi:predicted HicB family RNase H-like nuclease
MSKIFYIRNIPEQLHRELKAQAALQGVSLSELVIRYCQECLERDKKGQKKGG